MLSYAFQGIFQICGFPQGSLVDRGQPNIEDLCSALRIRADIFHQVGAPILEQLVKPQVDHKFYPKVGGVVICTGTKLS